MACRVIVNGLVERPLSFVGGPIDINNFVSTGALLGLKSFGPEDLLVACILWYRKLLKIPGSLLWVIIGS